MEQTYVMVKHDGVQRSLIGDIIQRFEKVGLKLTALRLFTPTQEQASAFYKKSEEWCIEKGQIQIDGIVKNGGEPQKTALEYGRGIEAGLVTYMTSGPVVGMVLEGNEAVRIAMKLIGGTQPLSSDVGTIRGDYTIDSYDLANAQDRSVRNLIHRSDDPKEAQREIELWLNNGDIVAYTHINELMLHDINLDGMWE